MPLSQSRSLSKNKAEDNTELQTNELLPLKSSAEDSTNDALSSTPSRGKALSWEPTKIAIDSCRWKALLRSIVHLLPVLVTVFVLGLSGLNVYWSDLGPAHQNMILQAWQFAAKGHEILIVASLSAIVLHRIRYELCASEGVPLGFLTAGYQLSSISYLWSTEFWGGILTKPPSGLASWWPPLSILIAFAVSLAAVAGPSSAIAMIPRLDWWDVPDHFFNTPTHKPSSYYIQANTSDLWPEHLTTNNLAPGCLNGMAVDETLCPNQGFMNVMNWASRHQNQGLPPNITIIDYSTVRYLTSSTDDQTTGWSISSSVSIRDARDLGDYWDYVLRYGVDVIDINRPTLIPVFPSGIELHKPLVQVQCLTHYDVATLREIEFPHDHLNSWPLESYQNDSWTMPVNFSANVRDSASLSPLFNETIEGHHLQDEIFFEWVDLANFTGAPALGALAAFWTGNGSTTALACTVDAHWAPVSIFLDPRYDGIIFQDSSDPQGTLAQAKSTTDATALKRITIDTGWANTLNSPNNGTIFDQTIYTTDIQALISALGGEYENNQFQITGEGGRQDQETISYRISTILGLYLTEGLASINQNESLVYHDYADATYVLQMNNLDDGPFKYPGWPDLSFEEYAERQGFTEVRIQVRRYGYGWSFQGVPIKLAATVLVLHALIALIHVFAVVFGGWTSISWTSMGQMLVLAFTSLPPNTLRNTSAGVECLSSWKQTLAVRELRDMRLHLVVSGYEDKSEDDDAGEKPKKQRRYA